MNAARYSTDALAASDRACVEVDTDCSATTDRTGEGGRWIGEHQCEGFIDEADSVYA